MLTFLVTSLLLVPVAHAYGSGAPVTACDTFRPGHGSQLSSGSAPYTVEVGGVTEYTPGGTITVTISGNSFQGLIMQVHEVGSDVPIGTFSNHPSNTRALTCRNDADTVTHSSTSAKNDPTFTWNVPSDLTADIEVVATVAVSYSAYYRQLTSSTLSMAGGAVAPETTQQSVEVSTSSSDDAEVSTVESPTDDTTQQNGGAGNSGGDATTQAGNGGGSSDTTNSNTDDGTNNAADSTALYSIPLAISVILLRIFTTA